MRKKFLSIALAVFLAASSLPVSSVRAEEATDIPAAAGTEVEELPAETEAADTEIVAADDVEAAGETEETVTEQLSQTPAAETSDAEASGTGNPSAEISMTETTEAEDAESEEIAPADEDAPEMEEVLDEETEEVGDSLNNMTLKEADLADAQEIYAGDTKVAKSIQAVTATYGGEGGAEKNLNGWIFKYTCNSSQDCAVTLSLSGSEKKRYVLQVFEKMDDIILWKDGVGVERTDMACYTLSAKGLSSGVTYYFVLQELLGETSVANVQDVTITINENVGNLDSLISEAIEVKPGTSYNSLDGAKVVSWNDLYHEVEPTILYKITLPANSKIPIDYSESCPIYELENESSLAYVDGVMEQNSGDSSGTLFCYGAESKTYYIPVDATSEYSATILFGEISEIGEIDFVWNVDLPTLESNKTVSAGDLKLTKQRLAYYRYNAQMTSKEGYWLKLTVPEDDCLKLKIESSSLKTDEYWSVIPLQNGGGYYRDTNVYDSNLNDSVEEICLEGDVYIFIETNALSVLSISVTELKNIEDNKDLAKEITEEDVSNGTITLQKLQETYKYRYGTGNQVGEYVDAAGGGCLAKIKVPAGTAYTLGTPEYSYLVIYEDDCKTVTEYGMLYSNDDSICNETAEDKYYYIWVYDSNESSDTITLNIKEVSAVSQKLSTATELKKDTTVTYKYDKTDPSYIENLTYIDVNRESMPYGKIYYVAESGDYTLKIETTKANTFKVYAINPELNEYISEENPNNQKIYIYDDKVETDLYIYENEKRYIIVACIDPDYLNETVSLTLTDLKENRKLVNVKDEAKELKVGENDISVANKKKYVFANYDKTGYTHAEGVLYKYTVKPKGRVYMNDNSSGGGTYYLISAYGNTIDTGGWLGYNDTVETYVNKTDAAQDLYVLLVYYSDFKLTVKDLGMEQQACTHGKTIVQNAKTATCTEKGYTGDTYCTECGETIKTGEIIEKTDHTPGEWIIDKAATTTSTGTRHKECTVCGATTDTETIPKLSTPTQKETPTVTTTYSTHVQTYGWNKGTSKNGAMSGTSGEAKRLEAIKLSVSGNDNLGIQYTTHCQSYGWLPWSANGELNGTEGEAKRLEAIKIQLTGEDADLYDVYYRVHAQSYGWLGWAKNGEAAGTAGYAKRLEGIQIVVLKKGEAAPGVNYAGINASSSAYKNKSYIAASGNSPVVGGGSTSNSNPSIGGTSTVNVAYKTHVQTFGWQGWKYNGAMSGTSGQAKRLEGINIKLTNQIYKGDIVYTTHVQTYGWQGSETDQSKWSKNGAMSGTSGEAKRLEAIKIALTGEMAQHYDVYYRVHAQSYGWLSWAKNGQAAGTAGYAKRLEGIQIVLVPKGSAAPANNYGGVTSVRSEAYISK